MKGIGIEPMKILIIEFTAQLQLPTLEIPPIIFHNFYKYILLDIYIYIFIFIINSN